MFGVLILFSKTNCYVTFEGTSVYILKESCFCCLLCKWYNSITNYTVLKNICLEKVYYPRDDLCWFYYEMFCSCMFFVIFFNNHLCKSGFFLVFVIHVCLIYTIYITVTYICDLCFIILTLKLQYIIIIHIVFWMPNSK